MSSWICGTCSHNRSQHRSEWNKFRGRWETSCAAQEYARSGRDVCRCSEFAGEKEGTA